MTSLHSRWLYLNLIALAILATVLWWWQQSEQPFIESKESWIPDYYLTHAAIKQFNLQGQLSSSISAQRFSHIGKSDSTNMLQPKVNIYLSQGDTWFGRADEGTILNSGTQINLTGDVLISNGPDLQRPLILTSQSLRLFPNNNYAESDTLVRLNTQYGHLMGTGMHLTLDDQRLQLLSQVTSIYSNENNK